MNRAFVALDIKALDDDARLIEGWASTASVDRMGDVVMPKGAIYKLPLPFLLDHDHKQAVGEVHRVEITDKGIKFWAHIKKIAEPGDVKDLCDKAWSLVKNGLRRAVSIGFSAREYDILSSGSYKFTVWEWLELSAVTVPAQAEAVITGIKSFSPGERVTTVSLPVPEIKASAAATGISALTLTHPGVTGKTLKPISLTPKEGKDMKNLAEQIAALEAKRAASAGRMEDVLTKSIERGETTSADEQEEFDAPESEVKQVDADIRRLKALEQVKLSAAKPVAGATKGQEASDARDPRVPAQVKVSDNLAKGVGFARFAKVKALSYLNHEPPTAIAKGLYGENSETYGIFAKAAAGAGSTTSPAYADLVLTEGGAFADFLDFLRPMTILGQFGNGGNPQLSRVPFDTALGWETSGGAAYWVGEGKAKPLTSFGFDRTTLAPLKVASIVPVTEELLRRSGVAAEERLRNLLAGAVAARIDIDFITPGKAAAAGVSPASITNGVTVVTSTGPTADGIREDVRRAMGTFIAANNAPTTGVWIMSSARALAISLLLNPLGQQEFGGISMRGGTFLGMPVIVSDYVPANIVVLVNARDIWFADEGGIQIDMSREASLEMADNPTGDSVAPTGAAMVSMWQTNSVAFRAERILNWAKARPTAVAVIGSVAWGEPPVTP